MVILGLLVGGILAGQSLIRASELRSISSDFQRYQTSYYSFRNKYFALPGDMTNATSFWGIRTGSGSVTGSDVTCHATISVVTGTCNGNGDGRNFPITGDASGGELYLPWQHLSFGGMIEGSFTGASASTGSSVATAGTNTPLGRIGGTYFGITWFTGPMSGDTNYFDGSYNKNYATFNATSGYPLKPEEAWNIDTKLDDGKPGTGAIMTMKNTSVFMPNCADSNTAATAQYSLSRTDKVCAVFRTL